jgi:ATP-dependent helicase/nuclease subunit B
MNTLTKELGRICRARLLDEKWVVAPSLRAGHQWLLGVARSGQPVVNAHVKTLTKLALDLAGPAMAAEGFELVSPRRGALLIDRIMARLRDPHSGYLWRLSPSARLAETVFRAINAMRLAALDAGELRAELFEVDAKGRELRQILTAYIIELHDRKWIDRADVLMLAIERLQADANALASDVVVLVPEDMEVAGLERRLLDALPARARTDLKVDHPYPAPAEDLDPTTDARLLRWLLKPSEAPKPSGDGTAFVFRAVGEVNEVREVLRRCLAVGIPLDEVEVLCTDVATYAPLIYETFARLHADDASLDEIPVTFQEGIPARKFRPGRALSAWLAWIRDDYPQRGLVQLIQEGLLDIPGHNPETISFSRLASILRGLGIGFGRDRYRQTLDQQVAGMHRRMAEGLPPRDEDGDDELDQSQYLQMRLTALELLQRLVESLLELSPRSDDASARVLDLAQRFVEERARSASRLDNYARRMLVAEIKDMRACLGPHDNATTLDARAWLAALPQEAWVGGLGPRGGCLHVAHVLAGGHSGRPYTFVIGLDDGRFPGAGLQDPIVLDEERRRLSQDLPTASRELAQRLDQFARLLARLRGQVTFSYSCHNLTDDREMFPSPVVLSAFRILSGQRDGDQADLSRWLAPAASFAPDRGDKALVESEWWLWKMSGTEAVIEPRTLVASRYPHLGRGFVLAAERKSDRFTVYDGWIPTPGEELDMTAPAGPIVSASRLETLGQCPLRYFFRYVLEIESPEELGIDPGIWLDPLARGSLLHEVFESFLKEVIERGDIPVADRDHDRVMAILNARIADYRTKIPPPSEAVFRRECGQLRRTAEIFLREDEEYCRQTGNRPLFLEVSIGLKPGESKTRLDSAVPVEVRLPDGTSLRVRGRIDRIDQRAGREPNVFEIWDYKTGSTWKYTRKSPPFWEGRVVQHSLYVALLNARLKMLGDEYLGARVERFGFFFPGGKARGERIEFTREQLADGGKVLCRLARSAASGAFLSTTAKDDCDYCDYRELCGDVVTLSAASKRKLKPTTNTILAPYRELRGYDQGND